MVICIVSTAVFGFLGIFSAKYRFYFKESLKCMKKKALLKKCDAKFEQKIKSKVSAKFIRFPRFARFIYKNFNALSWITLIIMLASMIPMVQGGYNLAVYGTCDPHSTQCIFNPGHLHCGSQHCLDKGCSCKEKGCTSPDFKACEGKCECKEGTCNI
ncbi:MAG TPA: hypothetical protein VJB11_02110 [archaeon]|nr:hypothetical protein [archaeon]